MMNIDGKILAKDSDTYFIADIAANHDGDITRAIDLIFLAAEAGADAAKFQHFQANTIVSDFGFKNLGTKLSHQAQWGKSVYDVYKDASVSLEWTMAIKKACKEAGISFFTTPYSLELVDELDQHVPAYKIGSGDINWLEMIEKVAQKNKPIFLATGASSMPEVESAVNTVLNFNHQLCVMQCNTNYTANVENYKYIQLNVLKTYAKMFPDCILGLSDHTSGCATVLGAVALGARAVEKHFTDDVSRTGPDHKFSMDPKSWKEMVARTRELEVALGGFVKKVEDNELETVILQRRALRATRDMARGEIIQCGDFVPLRPRPVNAANISPISALNGKILMRNLVMGDYLTVDDGLDN